MLTVRVAGQWSSLASTSPSGTIALKGASSGLYDLQINYLRAAVSTYPPRMKLTWLNTLAGSEANPAQTIQPYRLFTNLPVPSDDATFIDLVAAGTAAGTSVTTGTGLTTATAGMAASFTITARDSFANLRDLDEDSYVVSISGPTSRLTPSPVSPIATPGTYHVSFLPTESGDYAISVQRPTPGGLYGEWFNNMWLLGDPADTGVSAEVNFDWAAGFVTPRDGNSTHTGSDYVSVRWKGYFKAELTETYTFYVTYDDGLRLSLNGTQYIDNWEGNGTSSSNFSVSPSGGDMLELLLEYREVQGPASVKLYYSSSSVVKRILPSARLFNSPAHVFGSPYKLYVSPARTCGTTSFATGAGLNASTAGRFAAFTITAMDEYANARTRWEDTFVVRARRPDGTVAKHGTVGADISKGRYAVRYLVTAAGPMSVYASMAVTGGLFATYYSGLSSTYYLSPLKSEPVQQILPSTYAAKSAYTVQCHTIIFFVCVLSFLICFDCFNCGE
jgi:hypothetical protein